MLDDGGVMEGEIRLENMIQDLLQVEEEAWGRYAFSRELLNRRISPEKQKEMIQKAMACGKEYAKRMIQTYESTDIRVIAEKLKLKIEYKDTLLTGKRILFACYTPPEEIVIMVEPARKAIELFSKDTSNLVELFTQDGIMKTILGHEVFHVVEEQTEQEIYTRTEKILLWNFMGYKNYSTIRTLGEIGAMAFTKELNGLNYSPFILDVLLFYSYDPASAEKIYRDVLGMSSGRCRETIDDYK